LEKVIRPSFCDRVRDGIAIKFKVRGISEPVVNPGLAVKIRLMKFSTGIGKSAK
jgi:hypothetical protein